MSDNALSSILALGPELTPIEAPYVNSDDAISPIMYPEAYKEAMASLRAMMSAAEYSERALEMTRYVIGMNPAHYTVWTYRADALFALDSDLFKELQFIEDMAEVSAKNYQLWHHREVVVGKLGKLPEHEMDFLGRILDEDAKNYHVWTYRQWLVKRFNPPSELDFTAQLIKRDIYNNSAWNHRFFIYERNGLEGDAYDNELAYVQSIIDMEPENQSPWAYMRGLLKMGGREESTVKDFVRYHDALPALEFLASIYGATPEAMALFSQLEKRDPIRRHYWRWRKSQLQLPEEPTQTHPCPA
jgi:protein farnesyltransferase/geranylgeranyltransferase type-1 subunit alpha